MSDVFDPPGSKATYDPDVPKCEVDATTLNCRNDDSKDAVGKAHIRDSPCRDRLNCLEQLGSGDIQNCATCAR